MHQQTPAVLRRKIGRSRDENVRFGSKADIGLCDVRFARLSANCVHSLRYRYDRRIDFGYGPRHCYHRCCHRHACDRRTRARRPAGGGKPGVGMLLVRGLEIAAALVIVLFGAALLTGYMVSERLMGV
jgi:hypothetical protein